MKSISKWWEYSSLRFYWLNTIWNYSFWLGCKKVYHSISFQRTHPIRPTKREVKKRFAGYMFKGNLFLDNPGMPIKDRSVWEHWRKKGLF